MNKEELLKLAGRYFVSDTGLSVANLIRKIQIAEGHTDCFATGKIQCDQMACRWRKECLPQPGEQTATEPEAALSNKKKEITS